METYNSNVTWVVDSRYVDDKIDYYVTAGIDTDVHHGYIIRSFFSIGVNGKQVYFRIKSDEDKDSQWCIFGSERFRPSPYIEYENGKYILNLRVPEKGHNADVTLSESNAFSPDDISWNNQPEIVRDISYFTITDDTPEGHIVSIDVSYLFTDEEPPVPPVTPPEEPPVVPPEEPPEDEPEIPPEEPPDTPPEEPPETPPTPPVEPPKERDMSMIMIAGLGLGILYLIMKNK